MIEKIRSGEMENQVTLTDTELALVMTALEVNILTAARSVALRLGVQPDESTNEAILGMSRLYGRLKREYF